MAVAAGLVLVGGTLTWSSAASGSPPDTAVAKLKSVTAPGTPAAAPTAAPAAPPAAAPVASPVASPAARVPASVRLNQLGPENSRLARDTGQWDVVETLWPTAGAAPVVTRGLIAEREMIGPALRETLRSASDPTRTVLRTDYLTFNRVEGIWEYMSLDTRDPVALMPASSYDRGRGGRIRLEFDAIAIAGSGPQASGQLLRMAQDIQHHGPDRETKDQYFALSDGDGTPWLAHRYSYTRR